MKVIAVTELTVRYGQTTALDGVTMAVEPGEVVAVLGPNGAGKTTLFESIEGYRIPSSGTVEVFGANPVSGRSAINHRWGVMPQRNGLPMGLTVAEAVALFADLSGHKHNPDDLMAQTGLTGLAKRRWRRLSGGEQQRLSLAMALAGGKDLLILDEPTAAVDQEGRDRILSLIKQRSDKGASVLLSTHRLSDAEACADSIYVLNRGKLIGSGDLETLTTITDSIRVRSSPGLDVAHLTRVLTADVAETTSGTYRIALDPTPENVAKAVSGFGQLQAPVEGVDASRASLDEVLRDLVGNDSGEAAAQ